VLPLVNLSGDKEQEYFADGMTEALISELARVRGLRVVSRTSAMQFKGTHEGVPAIARRVNVDGVLEASVMRAGDRVRIRAQLVHAATDKPVWVGTYDRDLRNILALQTEVAQAIAQAIRLEITPAELARRVRARPVDPEAHQHYLVGLYYYQRQGQTPEGRERSREELQKAIDRDPNYAEAYVLLAENYWLSPGHAQDMPKAKAAALKAIELDDSLAMAHIALMKVRLFHDWDWAGAKAEGKRALELQPGLAAVHSNMSYLYWALGSVDDAVVEAQRAFDLDPLSIGATTQLARAYYFARQFDQSVKQSRSAIALDANDFWTHFYLSITLVHLGREAEAVEEFIAAERAGDVEGRELADAMEREYRRSGARAALRLQATTWERWAEAGRAQASSVAQTYAQMGEVDKAFSWLDRAYAQRSRSLLYLQTDPQFDSLRSDPRYQALVRKIGLPPLPAPSRQ
jgi:TolB-like protein/Tfp pilus assembly protein PilF